MIKTYKGIIVELGPNQIFVFGSNTQGRHGKGAAKKAMEFGAVYFKAKGLMGKTYAIITKDLTKSVHPSIPKDVIIQQIRGLYWQALTSPEMEYLVAYTGHGTNLNGYTNQEIADMFSTKGSGRNIPDNIIFEEEFNKLIKR